MDVTARLFYWPDPQGDTWVVAERTIEITPDGERWIWHTGGDAMSNVETALDMVMYLNKVAKHGTMFSWTLETDERYIS